MTDLSPFILRNGGMANLYPDREEHAERLAAQLAPASPLPDDSAPVFSERTDGERKVSSAQGRNAQRAGTPEPVSGEIEGEPGAPSGNAADPKTRGVSAPREIAQQFQ